MFGGFPPPSNSLGHQLGILQCTQFCYYLPGTRSQETAPSPLHTPISSCRSPGYPQLLSDSATNRGSPWPPLPPIQLPARPAHRTQGNTFTSFFFLKDMVKDLDEQPGEEIQRTRSGKVPEHRSFCPHGFGVCHPPSICTCSPTRRHSEPHTLGIFMEASSHRRDQ